MRRRPGAELKVELGIRLAMAFASCCYSGDMSKPGDVTTENAQGRFALAAATRRMIDEVRATNAPANVLMEAQRALEVAERLLSPYRRQGDFAQARLGGGAEAFLGEADPMVFFENSPFIGRANPISLPVVFEVRDGVVHGEATFTAPYCGPPNHVHGGVIAAVFDELLGTVNVVNQLGAMTGTLTIRYHQPTPLFREIRMEGHQAGVEGRKVFAKGSMWSGETLLAEAEGIFISLQEGIRERLFGPNL